MLTVHNCSCSQRCS